MNGAVAVDCWEGPQCWIRSFGVCCPKWDIYVVLGCSRCFYCCCNVRVVSMHGLRVWA